MGLVTRVKKIYLFLVTHFFCYELVAANMVTLTIDYGNGQPVQMTEVEFEPGMSALALLQRSAKIKTKEVSGYIFVTSINGVKSHSKTMGWFYEIDGIAAKKTASENILNDLKTMKWEFKIANCGI